jgi:hypothetical protein
MTTQTLFAEPLVGTDRTPSATWCPQDLALGRIYDALRSCQLAVAAAYHDLTCPQHEQYLDTPSTLRATARKLAEGLAALAELAGPETERVLGARQEGKA